MSTPRAEEAPLVAYPGAGALKAQSNWPGAVAGHRALRPDRSMRPWQDPAAV